MARFSIFRPRRIENTSSLEEMKNRIHFERSQAKKKMARFSIFRPRRIENTSSLEEMKNRIHFERSQARMKMAQTAK